MQTLGLSCAAFPSMPMNGEVWTGTWQFINGGAMLSYARVLQPFPFDVFMATNLSLAAIPAQALFQSSVHTGLILSGFPICSCNDNWLLQVCQLWNPAFERIVPHSETGWLRWKQLDLLSSFYFQQTELQCFLQPKFLWSSRVYHTFPCFSNPSWSSPSFCTAVCLPRGHLANPVPPLPLPSSLLLFVETQFLSGSEMSLHS